MPRLAMAEVIDPERGLLRFWATNVKDVKAMADSYVYQRMHALTGPRPRIDLCRSITVPTNRVALAAFLNVWTRRVTADPALNGTAAKQDTLEKDEVPLP